MEGDFQFKVIVKGGEAVFECGGDYKSAVGFEVCSAVALVLSEHGIKRLTAVQVVETRRRRPTPTHHPGTDARGHEVTECVARGCRRGE